MELTRDEAAICAFLFVKETCKVLDCRGAALDHLVATELVRIVENGQYTKLTEFGDKKIRVHSRYPFIVEGETIENGRRVVQALNSTQTHSMAKESVSIFKQHDDYKNMDIRIIDCTNIYGPVKEKIDAGS